MSILMKTAFTSEIDEVDDALADIFARVDLAELKQNSLAIVNCYPDFLESGVYRALAARLPFDVIGCTTMASSSAGDLGQYRLNLTILTSDDTRFTTGTSGPLNSGDYIRNIAQGYEQASADLGENPLMLLSYFPFSTSLSASDMLDGLDRAVKGTPVFGSVASGINMNYDGCYCFLNDEVQDQKMVFALLAGDLKPQFLISSLPDRNIREGRFMVTKSDGCVLYEVNDTPVFKYLESLGMVLPHMNRTTVPVMLYPVGSQSSVAVGVYNINDDQSLLLGAPVPVGTIMAIGEIDREGILSTATDAQERILRIENKAGALLSPCVSRYVMLSPSQDDEMIAFDAGLANKLAYSLSYAGGEICPILDSEGAWRNQFHNYSFSACVF